MTRKERRMHEARSELNMLITFFEVKKYKALTGQKRVLLLVRPHDREGLDLVERQKRVFNTNRKNITTLITNSRTTERWNSTLNLKCRLGGSDGRVDDSGAASTSMMPTGDPRRTRRRRGGLRRREELGPSVETREIAWAGERGLH